MRASDARAEGHTGTHRPKVRAMRRASPRGAACGPKDFVTAARARFKGGLRSKPPGVYIREEHAHTRIDLDQDLSELT